MREGSSEEDEVHYVTQEELEPQPHQPKRTKITPREQRAAPGRNPRTFKFDTPVVKPKRTSISAPSLNRSVSIVQTPQPTARKTKRPNSSLEFPESDDDFFAGKSPFKITPKMMRPKSSKSLSEKHVSKKVTVEIQQGDWIRNLTRGMQAVPRSTQKKLSGSKKIGELIKLSYDSKLGERTSFECLLLSSKFLPSLQLTCIECFSPESNVSISVFIPGTFDTKSGCWILVCCRREELPFVTCSADDITILSESFQRVSESITGSESSFSLVAGHYELDQFLYRDATSESLSIHVRVTESYSGFPFILYHNRLDDTFDVYLEDNCSCKCVKVDFSTFSDQ
jgi:hypothetical protein